MGNSTKMKLGGFRRGSTLKLYQARSPAEQTGKEGLDLANGHYLTLPAGERNTFLFPFATAQPMWSHHSCNSLLISMDFSFIAAFLIYPLSSQKAYLLLFSRLSSGFATACPAQIVILFHPWINPFLLVNNWQFLILKKRKRRARRWESKIWKISNSWLPLANQLWRNTESRNFYKMKISRNTRRRVRLNGCGGGCL